MVPDQSVSERIEYRSFPIVFRYPSSTDCFLASFQAALHANKCANLRLSSKCQASFFRRGCSVSGGIYWIHTPATYVARMSLRKGIFIFFDCLLFGFSISGTKGSRTIIFGHIIVCHHRQWSCVKGQECSGQGFALSDYDRRTVSSWMEQCTIIIIIVSILSPSI